MSHDCYNDDDENISKAVDKQRANKLKQTLKTLFKKLDLQNEGKLPTEAFQLLCETH